MSVLVRFWGVRGSIPVPGARTVRYGGNTACVEVRRDGRVLICDSGTGIRELGLLLMKEAQGKPLDLDLFITHTHWDHLQGWPFFVPAYIPKNTVRIHSAQGAGADFKEIFRRQMGQNYFPVELGDMAAKIDFHKVTKPFDAGGVPVKTLYTNHPGVDIAYRFEFPEGSVVYLTDHECHRALGDDRDFFTGQDKLVADFCSGADLLISDAQYDDEDYKTKRGWGHSRWRDAVELAAAAKVRRLALFHFEPLKSDDEIDAVVEKARAHARSLGAGFECFGAREGQEIRIG
ncbi:MAG: MBL fold metallo-hydrolase [Elusimicrobiota bacterium]|jgi:phosphoribosyl 1,2-cyclic phosphodiesterase